MAASASSSTKEREESRFPRKFWSMPKHMGPNCSVLKRPASARCLWTPSHTRASSGKRFRNSEILTVHDGKIVDVLFRLGDSARGRGRRLRQSGEALKAHVTFHPSQKVSTPSRLKGADRGQKSKKRLPYKDYRAHQGECSFLHA